MGLPTKYLDVKRNHKSNIIPGTEVSTQSTLKSWWILTVSYAMLRADFWVTKMMPSSFFFMKQIGRDLPFPNDCFLLGDKIYPNRYQILTPYTTTQLARKQGLMRRKCLKLNRLMQKYRVCVEHTIAELKCYKCLSSLWRHPRELLPQVVNICASPVCRRGKIGLIVYCGFT